MKSAHGEFQIEVPHDRQGEFEPLIIEKHQRRFNGFDENIISLYSDLDYPAEILPRLEYLKMRADEVIGNGLKRIFGRKIRWDARIKTYQKISIIPDDAPKFADAEFANSDEEEEDTKEEFDEELEEEYA